MTPTTAAKPIEIKGVRSAFLKACAHGAFLIGIALFYYFYLYRTPVTQIVPNTRNVSDVLIEPFDVVTLKASGLPPIQLATLEGKVVFVHLWATWCTSCQAELPILRQLRERFSSTRLHMIGIATQDQVNDVAHFLQTTHFPLIVYLDQSGRAAQALSITSIPQSAIVDQKGFLRLRIEGALREAHFEAINKILDELGV